MTESGDFNKHTFLSRVFGLNSTYNPSSSNPMLTDDNNNLQFSINNLHDNFEDEDDYANLNSENEDSTSGDSSDSESEDVAGSGNSLLFDQKRQIREQFQSEMLSGEGFDAVPESLLMEGLTDNNVKKVATPNRFERPPKPERNGFLEQIRETERSITPSLNYFGEKAKDIANKTFHSIPKSLPKGISFQLPNHAASSLLPPPVTHMRGESASPQYNQDEQDNQFTNMNQQRQLRGRLGLLSPMERSLWLWSNISNLDTFLEDVYTYYIGNGYQCIVLSRICDLLIIIFVVWISSFMGNCIDYQKLMNQDVTKFSEVKIEQCYSRISFPQKFLFFTLLVVLVLRIRTFYGTFQDLKEIKSFYNLLLGVSDDELQTISWSTIVKKIMILRDQNTNALISGNQNLNGQNDLKSKTRLNAHDIANRLMRKENYTIAIFNKNVLNSALTVPIINSYFLTKTLEWNLNLCIFDFVFNSNGQLKQSILNEHKRLSLSTELRKRFRLAGILSIFLTPFLVIYFVLYFFLKFFYDIKTNPSIIGSREFSPHAKWKLREFNELPHIFSKRLKLSREGASNYINQFPKEATNIVLKFISFVTGSLTAILVILTVIDHENFLNFELTEGRTVLFYISTFGAVFTICKGSITEDGSVFDPEASLRYVAQYTHYLPSAWEGRYHTEDVKNQFCEMFNLRLVLVLKEIASLIMLPYILYYRLPESSEKVIDFFREFSVHVDGLGYVCTFAMFNFDNNKDKPINIYQPNGPSDDPEDLRHDYYSSNDDKMAKSYMFFLESYGNEPLRQQPQQTKHHQRTGGGLKANTSNKGLLKSAILNNSIMDKRGGGASSVRYPPQFKHHSLNSSIYFRGNNNQGDGLTDTGSGGNGGGGDFMEDTTAGLSKDTKNYLNNLNNSMLLGESFQMGYPTTDEIEYNYRKHDTHANINSEDEDENDDNDQDEAGVLGLINQIYNHKEGVR
ncbi:hypothetical protein CANARDRAFT_205940 [[Candida] arabinofermentans NRRL YB-2248]|uniref:Autophagy-related protein 9 n=1 Tax=[Candida] arabinofermentans NRRL YB-2248 TaxID=983967 RepID=A0A1E4T6G1_9ASCO|nr:hypothetical protein CANARDRAFT_205940 [[Candida] arabinofermentans NRRL YB-2248]